MLQWASSRISLREATVRMMAGAAPGRTQLLLNGTLVPRGAQKGILCGKGDTKINPLHSRDVTQFAHIFLQTPAWR